MSILYPLMMLGVVAVGVPIWLHLRRRDESNLIEFSTLRFLEDQPIAKARPLWPQNWPLLLLRMLALLMLIAAFCWPYVEDEDAVIIRESRVYILDNTLSHQVDDGFETARDEIADALETRGLDTQIGVIELAATPRTLVRFGDDASVAANKIRSLEPTSERGNYVDAFRSAAEMLTTSLGAERRIVLLSDSQTNQWTLSENAPPFLPSEIDIALPPVANDELSNVSLSDPRARREFRDGQSWVQAAVTLTYPRMQGRFAVVFRDRGEEVFRREIEIDQPPAGASNAGTVVAEWQVDKDRWMLGEAVIVDLDDDGMLGDNKVFFSLPPVRPGRVELISTSVFLRRALDPAVMSERWEIQISETSGIGPRTDAEPPDVLCVDGQTLTDAQVRDRIRDDLGRGCGVMLMVDQANPVLAGFLRELGIELQPNQPRPSSAETFRYVFSEHPVFAPFRSTELGNLSEIEFESYRRLKVRNAVPIAFSSMGDPLLFEVTVGSGRMLVFAFAFERRDTNWPIHPTFIPFLDKTFDYLRGESVSVADYEPGESINWQLPSGVATDTLTVAQVQSSGNESAETFVDPASVDVTGRAARFLAASQPGHYGIRYVAGGELAAVIDVNPSPLESELSFDADPKSLSGWKRTSDATEESTESVMDLELTDVEALQQPYWWYLMLTAALLFAAESVCGVIMSRN